MATSYSPAIPTQDLALYLDGASTKSATSDGTWRDISGNNRGVDVYGSPNIVTLGGTRCYELNSVGDRFVAQFGSDQYTNNLTLEAWIYPAASELTSGDRGAIIQGYTYMSWNKSNNKLSNYWYSTNNQGYHEPSSGMTRQTWNHLISVWDASASALYQYVNGSLVNTISTVASSGFYYQSINIGWEGDSRQFAGGLGLIKIYNRALSSSEALDCYNQTKSRFGR